MKDIANEPFILLDATHCLGEQIVSFFRQQERLPQMNCRSAQLLTVQELVALGRGVSLIPQMACALDRSGRVVYRSFSGKRPTRTLAMAWRKDRYQSPLVTAFFQAARETAGQHS